jgi:hypothetical protein
MSPTTHTAASMVPLLTSTIATTLLTLLTRHYFKYEGIADDVNIWSGFFTVFGVIYAIVAGFLLVEVPGRFGRLSNTIEAELNAVESLRAYLVYLGDSGQKAGGKSASLLLIIWYRFEIRNGLKWVARPDW